MAWELLSIRDHVFALRGTAQATSMRRIGVEREFLMERVGSSLEMGLGGSHWCRIVGEFLWLPCRGNDSPNEPRPLCTTVAGRVQWLAGGPHASEW